MSDSPNAPLVEILVIGFGALGTVYSYLLSNSTKCRVTAVARSTFSVIQEKGVTIESEKYGTIEGWKPDRLVGNPEDANDRPYDYIVVTHKCLPDLIPTASVISPFIEGPHGKLDSKDPKEGPTVVLIQNGIGIEHPVQTAYPRVPIISCVAWIGANMHADGHVTHGNFDKLVIGLYSGEGNTSPRTSGSVNPAENDFYDPALYLSEGGPERKEEGLRRTQQFAELLVKGGGEVEVVDDIQPQRYGKNAWNIAFSSICAMSRQPVSAILSPSLLPYTLPVARRAMLEQLFVAREWGYGEDVLPLSTIDDAIRLTTRSYQDRGVNTPMTPGIRANDKDGMFPKTMQTPGRSQQALSFKPSMLLDVEAGRPFELEPIIGSVLDRARLKGVETPRLDVFYSVLKINQDVAVRKLAEDQEELFQQVNDWALRRPSIAGIRMTDGRKSWESAVRKAEIDRASRVAVKMSGGRTSKVTGKPVFKTKEDSDEDVPSVKFE